MVGGEVKLEAGVVGDTVVEVVEPETQHPFCRLPSSSVSQRSSTGFIRCADLGVMSSFSNLQTRL